MRIVRMNWMQIEEYLRRDDRVVLPLGSIEQHAYLSLATDSILAERIAADAAEPLGIPVYPCLSYGLSPYFMAYPGTVTLRPDTYARVLHDILNSLIESGFRRILIVNGHGGNNPVRDVVGIWARSRPGIGVRFHNWWNAPRTWAKVQATDPVASHASWMENFPWSRLSGVDLPEMRKKPVDVSERDRMTPKAFRALLGDGSFGGRYWRPEEQMMEIWVTAVAETRAVLDGSWEEPEEGSAGDGGAATAEGTSSAADALGF